MQSISFFFGTSWWDPHSSNQIRVLISKERMSSGRRYTSSSSLNSISYDDVTGGRTLFWRRNFSSECSPPPQRTNGPRRRISEESPMNQHGHPSSIFLFSSQKCELLVLLWLSCVEDSMTSFRFLNPSDNRYAYVYVFTSLFNGWWCWRYIYSHSSSTSKRSIYLWNLMKFRMLKCWVSLSNSLVDWGWP